MRRRHWKAGLRAGLFVCGCAVGTISVAAASDSVELDALTSTEVRERIDQGWTTVLLPIGGTEQSGPHLALGKHNQRVAALSQQIARRLGQTLVAPVMAYVPEGSIDPPVAHMRFAGTISVPESAFESVVASAAQSLCHHGFRDVVLLGDHGGYQRNLQQVAARWDRSPPRKGPAACRVHALVEYYRASQAEFADALRAKGFAANEIGNHAGLADTALSMALNPGTVRADKLVRGAGASVDGVDGDPRRASADLGQIGVKLIVDTSVSVLQKRIPSLSRPPADPPHVQPPPR